MVVQASCALPCHHCRVRWPYHHRRVRWPFHRCRVHLPCHLCRGRWQCRRARSAPYPQRSHRRRPGLWCLWCPCLPARLCAFLREKFTKVSALVYLQYKDNMMGTCSEFVPGTRMCFISRPCARVTIWNTMSPLVCRNFGAPVALAATLFVGFSRHLVWSLWAVCSKAPARVCCLPEPPICTAFRGAQSAARGCACRASIVAYH